jgi:hypothetical protein
MIDDVMRYGYDFTSSRDMMACRIKFPPTVSLSGGSEHNVPLLLPKIRIQRRIVIGFVYERSSDEAAVRWISA